MGYSMKDKTNHFSFEKKISLCKKLLEHLTNSWPTLAPFYVQRLLHGTLAYPNNLSSVKQESQLGDIGELESKQSVKGSKKSLQRPAARRTQFFPCFPAVLFPKWKTWPNRREGGRGMMLMMMVLCSTRIANRISNCPKGSSPLFEGPFLIEINL